MTPADSSRKFRCALIGCGGVSRSHAEFYPGYQRAQLVACADPNPKACDKITVMVPDCRRYSDYSDLLASEELDVVIVATRPNLHHAVTTAAAKAGVRAILCEKPMAIDLAQARDMVEFCRERAVRLVIGHQRRYDPQYVAAMRAITSGHIGEPVAIEAYWPCPAACFMGTHSQATDGGGVIMCLGVHLFDMLDFCLGCISKVSCRLTKKLADTDIEDSAVCKLTLQTGPVASAQLGEFAFDITGTAPCVAPLRFFVSGSEGAVTFGDFSLSAWAKSAGALEWRELPPRNEHHGKTGFQRLHEAIFSALEQDVPTLCDGHIAIRAQKVAMACYESGRTGRPADVCDVPLRSPLEALNRQRPAVPWRVGGM